jgi:hypothetical protein
MARPLTEDQYHWLHELDAHDVHPGHIAEALGCSMMTVYRHTGRTTTRRVYAERYDLNKRPKMTDRAIGKATPNLAPGITLAMVMRGR